MKSPSSKTRIVTGGEQRVQEEDVGEILAVHPLEGHGRQNRQAVATEQGAGGNLVKGSVKQYPGPAGAQ